MAKAKPVGTPEVTDENPSAPANETVRQDPRRPQLEPEVTKQGKPKTVTVVGDTKFEHF